MGAFDQQLAVALTQARTGQEWLDGYRRAASAAWLAAGLPGRKTEAWKYTQLDALNHRELCWTSSAGVPAEGGLIAMDADRLVFVDGHFCADRSSLSGQAGVHVVPFSSADSDQQARILRYLGTLQRTADNPFVCLNDSWLHDGVLIWVDDEVEASRPVYLVHQCSAGAQSQASSGHTLVVLGRHARLSLTEHFLASPGSRALQLNSTEILLRDGAALEHNRVHMEQQDVVSVSAVALDLAAQSSYQGFMLAGGSALKRIDLSTTHNGAGSDYRFDGVYLARGSEHIDIHSCVDHAKPHGTTDERFRGIIDDEARAVFNGRIHICEGAQKTSADLSNRNLLLSAKAEINTKPELEIYADDVSCSHGATVSQIDERSLYYLQSRGISRREAEVLLGFGFVNELLSSISNEPVHDAMRGCLRGWYGSEDLTRHLQ